MRLSALDFFRAERQTVAVEPRNPQTLFPLHDHDFDELVIVQSGNGWHVLNGTPYFITCGEVFYVRRGDVHEFESVCSLRLTNILFRPELARICTPELLGLGAGERHWQVAEDVLAELHPLLCALVAETSRRDAVAALMAETLFLQIGLILLRHRCAAPQEQRTEGGRIGRVLRHIRENCAEEIDFDALARLHGFAARQFARAFREATGTTPHNFLRQTRINRAMRALGDSASPVTEIAYECGFNDSNYFSFCFSSMVGLSPSEYRRRARDGKPASQASSFS